MGIALDTGALIAIERGKGRMRAIMAVAIQRRTVVTVPSVVVVEWWRARSDFAEKMIASFDVEPLRGELAQLAGEAIANVKGATLADAVVMASAAQRGDAVYSSDVDDLTRLQRVFPNVRVFGI